MKEATRLLSRGEQPSVGEIARAAGVSRTTFYRSFPSRADLLVELKVEPEPDTRQRVVDAARRLLQTQTLADLSMDELALEARVSRASLYRLFPGKAALFRAILIAYSPFEPVMGLLDRLGDRPPDELIPELVATAYRAVAGQTGIARTLVFEVTSMTADTQEAFAETGLRAFGRLSQYLASQMAAGRLRRVHPMLALQSLVGSVMIHVLSEPLLSQARVDVPAGEEAVRRLAELWLRGMRPEG